MNILKVEGFILKKKNLLNTDLFLTMFTKEHGKMALMAKGARKITSRRAAHLQSGNLVKARISSSQDRMFLQSTDLVSGFLQLRTEPISQYIYILLAVVDRLLPEMVPEPEIFIAMKSYMVQLARGDAPQEVLRISLQTILNTLGYVDREESLSDLILIAEENMDMKLPSHVIM